MDKPIRIVLIPDNKDALQQMLIDTLHKLDISDSERGRLSQELVVAKSTLAATEETVKELRQQIAVLDDKLRSAHTQGYNQSLSFDERLAADQRKFSVLSKAHDCALEKLAEISKILQIQ